MAFIYTFAALVGACIGSFINVVILRLPEKGAFLSNKRSHCPECKAQIKPYNLIPVISYFILRGRCFSCKTRISPRYPLVELAGAAFAVICLFKFGLSLSAVLAFGVIMILLAIALIDYDTVEIPNSLVIALIPFAIASVWLMPDAAILSRIIGIFSVALPMLLTSLAISGAFGGGDIKLMAVCGFLLGWELTLLAFFIALLLCAPVAVYTMANSKRKRGQHIVFGPALCSGVVVSLFFGSEILNWYLGFLSF